MKISVVIPVFNGKKYLKQAINSVIRQTMKPIEILLIDDGSTDDSLASIQNIVASFPIHRFRQENRGQSSARNRGIRAAKGDFIALLDQDDLWHPQHLERLSQPFKKLDGLGWTYSNVDQIDENNKIFKSNILDFCPFKHPQQDLLEMIKTDMHILPGATLIRKTALLSVDLFDERLSGYEDDDLFLRLYAAKWKSIHLPQALLKWRIHSGNSGTATGFKSRRIYAQKIVDNFSSQFPAISEIIGSRFFQVTLGFYKQALNEKNFSRCKELHADLSRYFKLATNSLNSWKYKVPLMKYPRIVGLAIKIKRRL